MVELRNFKNLVTLNLGETRVTHEGLKELKGLKNLSEVTIFSQNITDASLRVLREIGLLHKVTIAEGDSAFEQLHPMKSCSCRFRIRK